MKSSQASSAGPVGHANEDQNSMRFTLRQGRPEDAPECGKICYEAFKMISESHNFPPDFPSVEAATGLMTAILPKSDVYSVVAESAGRILGSNFLWEDTIAGVGPITVDPAVQNSTIGRRLMHHVLDYSRRNSFAGVRLVQAAFHNRSYPSTRSWDSLCANRSRSCRGLRSAKKSPGTLFAQPPRKT